MFGRQRRPREAIDSATDAVELKSDAVPETDKAPEPAPAVSSQAAPLLVQITAKQEPEESAEAKKEQPTSQPRNESCSLPKEEAG
eukprot:4601589-Amphidinium_carterae.1